MKKWLIFAIMLYGCHLYGQSKEPELSNLIPNSSFEQMKNYALGWYYSGEDYSRIVKYWNSPTQASPDYYCSKCEIPINWKEKGFGDKNPHTGKSMSGITLYGCKDGKPHCREYLQIELTEKLIKNQNYYIEFWVNHLRKSMLINNIGVAFKNEEVKELTDQFLSFKPMINASKIVRSKNGEWIKISSTFKSIDNSQYLIIGNFYDDDHTQNTRIDEDGLNYAYYYIDDVVLKKIAPILPVQYEDTDLHNVVIKKGETIVLNQVYFDFDKFELTPKSFYELNLLVGILKKYNKMKIEISGHTDSIGEYEYNDTLSMQRAQEVKNYLIENGIKEDRLISKGFGERNPKATNMYELGRKINRRVEFKILEL